MNPLSIFAVLMVIGFAWMLVNVLRRGEFRFSRGRSTLTAISVRRAERPTMFWTLVAFYVGLACYVGSFAFME